MDSTTVTLTSSFNPSNLGQSVTFTAQVKTSTVGSGSPTGTVTFFEVPRRSAPPHSIPPACARFTATGFALAARTHTITARYNGDANFLVSTSTALTQTVRSVQDQGTALMAKIDSLVSSGLLNSADGNALKAMISDAMKLFAGGSTSAGISKMNAFIVKVNDLLEASRMKETDAKFLIDAAQSIIVSAQGP